LAQLADIGEGREHVTIAWVAQDTAVMMEKAKQYETRVQELGPCIYIRYACSPIIGILGAAVLSELSAQKVAGKRGLLAHGSQV